MYSVLFSRRASRSFDRLPQRDAHRVRKALDALARNPRRQGTIKLTNAPVAEYRCRIGDFRLLFDIDDDHEQILLYDIRRRSGQTYRR